jgi:hypothetical protein
MQQLCNFGLKGVFLGAHGVGSTKRGIKKKRQTGLTQHVHILRGWVGFQDPIKAMAYVRRSAHVV